MLVKRIAACSHASIVNRFPVIQPVSSKVRHFGTFFAHMASPGYAPGTITIMLYMDGKRIQCWSNALQHIPICLQPFTSYRSEIATFSCSLAFNAPVGGVPISHWNNEEKFGQPFTSCRSEIATFSCSLAFNATVGGVPISHWNNEEKFGPQQTRIMGLSGSEDSLTIG